MSRNNYLLAVSGGVDSMLMAHVFAASNVGITVAHFNHQLRPDSHLDEQLVQDFAKARDLPFLSERAHLPDASEDTARQERHAFLARVNHSPQIATAHHLDDLVESVAINLIRGTGWRGLAVLGRKDYVRPLLELEKSEVVSLARELGVQWREDSTNQSPDYLRNRLREHTARLPFDNKWQLLKLRDAQIKIAREIDLLLQEYHGNLQRRELYNLPKTDELDFSPELLRFTLLRQNIRATRPEIDRLLDAIRSYQPGKKFQLSNDKFVLIGKDDFTLPS